MENLKITFDSQHNRRLLESTEVVVHCHHYNCQLQSCIESSQFIDGPRLLKDVAKDVFGKELEHYISKNKLELDSAEKKWDLARKIYKTHGFGTFDWQNLEEGKINSCSSHFAEGWKAKFGVSNQARCSLTCGFLERAYELITSQKVQISETKCMAMGNDECVFEITSSDETQIVHETNKDINFTPFLNDPDIINSSNVNEKAIIEAIASIPVYGDEQGLIPMFGIYATNVPADYYNQISYLYELEMAKEGKDTEESARSLLVFGGEVCGLHTFHGIMASQEWESLVSPMLKNREDSIFSLIAITNAFGWGNWAVTELQPMKKLVLRSYNGYEALGYRKMFGKSEVPRCYMLTGVSAGLMELIYSSGTLEDKFGKYHSWESKCIAKGDPYCEFVVEKF
ncbi:V4R domain-containing protein [Candidatus Uabimicrobium sp. HlEnr_7]|uniref:V4R domain-containing protein n=1 Tax=Candidatus Uabimicrobium helgolandensis TaxID=3095367 RepID=UPI003557B823